MIDEIVADDVIHHAVHNVPLARLVFAPQHDGRLHRCAIGTINAGYDVTSGGVEAEGQHSGPPSVETSEASRPGGKAAGEIAA